MRPIDAFRSRHPGAYDDVDDLRLARALHRRYQADRGAMVPEPDFVAQLLADDAGTLTLPGGGVQAPSSTPTFDRRRAAIIQPTAPAPAAGGSGAAPTPFVSPRVRAVTPAPPPPVSPGMQAVTSGLIARVEAEGGPELYNAPAPSRIRQIVDSVLGSPTAAGTPQGETDALLTAAAERRNLEAGQAAYQAQTETLAPWVPQPAAPMTGAQYGREIGARTGPLERGLGDVASGALGVVSGLTAAGARVADSPGLRTATQAIEGQARDLMPADPLFIDKVAQGLGSAAAFYLPGLGIARGVEAAYRVAPALAQWAGAGTSAALEAAVEAGLVYEQNRQQGLSHDEAARRADAAFTANAALVGVTNRFGLFNEAGGQIARRGQGALVEGGQEGVQQVISNVTTGQPATEGAGEATAIGALVGGTLAGNTAPAEQRLGDQFARTVETAEWATPADDVARMLLQPQEGTTLPRGEFPLTAETGTPQPPVDTNEALGLNAKPDPVRDRLVAELASSERMQADNPEFAEPLGEAVAIDRAHLEAYDRLSRGELDGLELATPDGERKAIIIQDAAAPGRWRFSRFDARGFAGHVGDLASANEALAQAIADGYTQAAPGSLEAAAASPEFRAGNERADVIQAVNSRQISTEEADRRLGEIARRFAPPAEAAPAEPEAAAPAAPAPAPAAPAPTAADRVRELTGRYKPGNPFAEKAAKARARAERLAAGLETERDRAMSEAFPLGGGFQGGSQRSNDRRIDSAVDRATRWQEAEKEAAWREGQAEAFDAGRINAQGRMEDAGVRARRERREANAAKRAERRAAAEAQVGDGPKWRVTPDVWADSTGNFGGGAREFVLAGHREAVKQALAAGEQVPAEVLAAYPDLQAPKVRTESESDSTGQPTAPQDGAPPETPAPTGAPPRTEAPAAPDTPDTTGQPGQLSGFQATHELPDGTPVVAVPDEAGVWRDAEGNEYEDEGATPIAPEAAPAAASGDDLGQMPPAAPKKGPPSLGSTVDEVWRGWQQAHKSGASGGGRVVVGWDVGTGAFYSLRPGGKINRDTPARGRNLATTREATKRELAEIDEAIRAGRFQVQIQPPTGVTGRPMTHPMGTTVLHQSTGKPLTETPAPAPTSTTPAPAEALNAMRYLRGQSEEQLRMARERAPKGGEIAVGGAHVDHLMRGEGLAKYLAELGRGQSAEAALEAAKAEAAVYARTWNEQRRDYVTERWEGGANSWLEEQHRWFLMRSGVHPSIGMTFEPGRDAPRAATEERPGDMLRLQPGDNGYRFFGTVVKIPHGRRAGSGDPGEIDAVLVRSRGEDGERFVYQEGREYTAGAREWVGDLGDVRAIVALKDLGPAAHGLTAPPVAKPEAPRESPRDVQRRMKALEQEREQAEAMARWRAAFSPQPESPKRPAARLVGFTKRPQAPVWFPVLLDGTVVWTNGHALDTNEPKVKNWREAAKEAGTSREIVAWNAYNAGATDKLVDAGRVVPRKVNGKTDRLTAIGRFEPPDGVTTTNTPVVYLERGDGTLVGINAHYHDWMRATYPTAEWYQPGDDGPILIEQDGTPVAVVMPLRFERNLPDGERLTPARVRELAGASTNPEGDADVRPGDDAAVDDEPGAADEAADTGPAPDPAGDPARAAGDTAEAGPAATDAPRPARVDPKAAKIAAKLRKAADGLDAQIEAKRNPGVARQNATARRARIAEGMGREADRLEGIQRRLRELADMHEAGTVPEVLRGVTTRADVESVLYSRGDWPQPSLSQSDRRNLLDAAKGLRGIADERARLSSMGGKLEGRDLEAFATVVRAIQKAGRKNPMQYAVVGDQVDRLRRFERAGITTRAQLQEAHEALSALGQAPRSPQDERARKVAEIERSLVGEKGVGVDYFPTPAPVVDRMLAEAGIQDGMRVLEPSAGKGNILDRAQAAHPGAEFTAVELSGRLADLLEAKGYTVHRGDFMEFGEGQRFDRILMNPPFSKYQDAEHIRHAYGLLEPGGRLVAIMSEGPWFRSDKRGEEWRAWAEEHDATSIPLDAGELADRTVTQRSDVRGRIVVLQKPANEAQAADPLGEAEKALPDLREAILMASRPLTPGETHMVVRKLREIAGDEATVRRFDQILDGNRRGIVQRAQRLDLLHLDGRINLGEIGHEARKFLGDYLAGGLQADQRAELERFKRDGPIPFQALLNRANGIPRLRIVASNETPATPWANRPLEDMTNAERLAIAEAVEVRKNPKRGSGLVWELVHVPTGTTMTGASTVDPRSGTPILGASGFRTKREATASLEALLTALRRADPEAKKPATLPPQWSQNMPALVWQRLPDHVYRGEGRDDAASIYGEHAPRDADGRPIPILGRGASYYAMTESAAREYGRDVYRLPLNRLENPLVIDRDSQWRDLARRAGWEFPNPSGIDGETMQRMALDMQAVLREDEHDALILAWDESIPGDFAENNPDVSVKLLRQVFGEPQVIALPRSPARRAEQRVTPGEDDGVLGMEAPGGRVPPRARAEKGQNWPEVATLPAPFEVEATTSGPAYLGEDVTLFPDAEVGELFPGAVGFHILDSATGQKVGDAVLSVDGDRVVALEGIWIDEARRGEGWGRRVMGSIVASTDGPIEVRGILDTAEAFWRRIGTYGIDEAASSGLRNGQLDADAFRAAAEAGRGAPADAGEPAGGARGSAVQDEGEGADPQPELDLGPAPAAATAAMGAPGANYVPLRGEQVPTTPYQPRPRAERGEIVRREDVLEPFLKALGVNVYEGRVRGRSRLGFFRSRGAHQGEIRIKAHGDLEVTAHEVAHWLDDRAFHGFDRARQRRPWLVGPDAKTYARELKSVSYDSDKVYEGWAEFVRLWMTQPDAAAAAAPQFNEWFDRWVNLPARENPYGQAIREARGRFLAWYEQDAANRQASKIGTQARLNLGRTSVSMRGRQSVLDDLEGILAMERDLTGTREGAPLGPYQNARLMRAAHSIVDGALRFGAPVAQMDRLGRITSIEFTGEGLEDILRPVSGALEDFLQYAVAVSAAELKTQGRERLFTVSEIQAGLALNDLRPRGEDGKTDFERAFAAYQAWNKRIVNFAVQMGVIDPKARAKWRREFYLPFYRVGAPAATKRAGGIEGNVSVWKGLTGGTGNLRDVLQNMVQNASTLIVEGLKNQARLQVVNFAANTPGGGQWIAPIAREAHRDTIAKDQVLMMVAEAVGLPKSAIARAAEGDMSKVPDELVPVVESILEWAAQNPAYLEFMKLNQAPRVRTSEQIVAVLRAGKASFYEVSDPVLWRALASFNREYGGQLRRTLNAIRRFGQNTITLALDFMAANIWRDTLHGWAFSRHGFRPVIDSARGMASRIRSDDLYRQWIANGGGMASYLVEEDQLRTQLERFYTSRGISWRSVIHSPRRLLYALETLADSFESATRIGEFERAMKRGESPRVAAYSSREVSTDFAMRGDSEFAGWAYDTILFLKAAVNGMDRAYRGFTKDAHAGSIMLKTGLIGLLSAMLAAWNDDNPLYQELEDWDRDGHWHVFIRNGAGPRDYVHLRFPKIWEIGAIASVAERSMQQALAQWRDGSGDVRAYGKYVWTILANQLKVDWVPFALEPLYEVYALNEERFTGRPVLPEGMRDRIPALQAGAYTNRALTELGEATAGLPEALQVSPARAESLIRGYFNTFGMYGLALLDEAFYGDELPDTPWTRLPGVRRFTGAQPGRVQAETDFYAALEAARKVRDSAAYVVRSARPPEIAERLYRRPEAAEVDVLEKTRALASELTEDMRLVYNDPDMTSEQKRRALDELRLERNRLFIETMGALREERRRAAGE